MFQLGLNGGVRKLGVMALRHIVYEFPLCTPSLLSRGQITATSREGRRSSAMSVAAW